MFTSIDFDTIQWKVMKNSIVSNLAIIAPILALLLPLPLLAADLEITEIMYDPEGSDASYEWLEVHNVSGGPLDLADWAFYEDDTAHGLKDPDDSDDPLTLAADARAVIARSPNDFKSRHSSFSAVLADSTFSLINSGETLALETPDGDIVSEVTYDPSIGADGDGNSLQWTGSKWIAAAPTPGEVNATGGSSDNDDVEEEDSETSAPQFVMRPRDDIEDDADPAEDRISIDAGSNLDAFVGLPVKLAAELTGHRDGDDISFGWSPGTGEYKSGTSTSYTYSYPGRYVATFSLTFDSETIHDQITVDVIAPEFSLETELGTDGYVKIKNDTGRRADLSGWELVADGESFTLPEYSEALSGGQLIVPNKVSQFISLNHVSLKLPTGDVATSTQPARNSSSQSITYSAPRAADDTSNSASKDTTVLSATETSQTPTSSATTSENSAGLVIGTNTAAVAAAGQFDVFAQWGGLLLALLLAAIGTVVLMRRVSKSAADPAVQAAKFDINEID